MTFATAALCWIEPLRSGCRVDSDGSSSSDAHHTTVLRSALRRVRRHLETIDQKKASTLLLHDVWGYELREIAQLTHATESAAQSRLVRGRRELHKRIAADPELADLLQASVR